jgi:membrane fusion protein, macrolide-specific efflux system
MRGINKMIFKYGAAIILSTSFIGCGMLPKEEEVAAPALIQPPKVTYKTVTASRGTMIRKVQVRGKLVAVNQQTYSFESRSGYIKSLNFKAGDMVKRGDLLATLDSDRLESEVAVAKLKMKIAELNFSEMSSNAAASELQKQKAELDLEIQRIQLKDLEKELAKTKIYAVSSGRVVYAGELNPGEYIAAYREIYKIADPSDMYIEFVGQQSNEFRVGMKVSVQYNNKTYIGEVVVSPEIVYNSSPKVGSTPYIKVKFEQLPQDAKLGEFAEISVELERKDNIVKIPRSTLRKYDNAVFVQVLENNAKVERLVEVGMESLTEVEIVKGINEGELIIED